MSHYLHAVKPNPSFTAQCREAMASGKWAELPHNWQARITIKELRSVYRAKFKYVSGIAARKEKMPRGWNQGLTEKERMQCYELRGFGSDSMEREKVHNAKKLERENFEKAHGGKKTIEIMKIAEERRRDASDRIERKRIDHRRRRIAARHYDEVKPSYRVGSITFVPGCFRGHDIFYGRNYLYYSCDLVYVGSDLIGIRFNEGTPTEALSWPILEHLNVRVISYLVKINLHLYFSRFEYDLHFKNYNQEITDYARNESDLKYANTHNWFDEVREEIIKQAKFYHDLIEEYNQIRGKIDWLDEVVKDVGLFNCGEYTVKSLPSFYDKTDFENYRNEIVGRTVASAIFYEAEFERYSNRSKLCKSIKDNGQTSKESARQLRALGFVA